VERTVAAAKAEIQRAAEQLATQFKTKHGHRGSRRKLVAAEHVDDVVNFFAEHCEHCSHALPETPNDRSTACAARSCTSGRTQRSPAQAPP
jgi:hypothetical protein